MPLFGETLRRCRQKGVGLRQPSNDHKPAAVWTQEALAEAIGLAGPDMVRRWEKNEAKPSEPNFANLRTAFSTPDTTAEHADLLEALVGTYRNWPGVPEHEVTGGNISGSHRSDTKPGQGQNPDAASTGREANEATSPNSISSVGDPGTDTQTSLWVAIGAVGAVVAAVFAVVQYFSPADSAAEVTQEGSGIVVHTGDNSPANVGGVQKIIGSGAGTDSQ